MPKVIEHYIPTEYKPVTKEIADNLRTLCRKYVHTIDIYEARHLKETIESELEELGLYTPQLLRRLNVKRAEFVRQNPDLIGDGIVKRILDQNDS